MCLTIPGKLIEIKKDKFIIDYGQEKREALASAIPVKIGDFVIVSNKVIINKLSKEQAESIYEMLK